MMKTTRMIAVKDRLTYGTRMMRAGQPFEAEPGHVHVLTVAGLEREVAREPSELERWRQCYLAAIGKPADKRWSLARLRKELEADE